jgi:hypothetical protein
MFDQKRTDPSFDIDKRQLEISEVESIVTKQSSDCKLKL